MMAQPNRWETCDEPRRTLTVLGQWKILEDMLVVVFDDDGSQTRWILDPRSGLLDDGTTVRPLNTSITHQSRISKWLEKYISK